MTDSKKVKLINKYRPENFSEIVGQKNQIEILTGIVKSGGTGGAYLFSGESGVGKSASALCFAFALNCLNYNFENKKICGKCKACLERNSVALYSGIYQYNCGMFDSSTKGIKWLSNQLTYSPLNKFNVFIFEEVHAWNPMVQTKLATVLENIPEHSIVIFTTSEINQLRPFFRERCTQIQFREPSENQIIKRLLYINEKEGAVLKEDELKKIASAHFGHVRAAINSMERLFNGRKMNKDLKVEKCL